VLVAIDQGAAVELKVIVDPFKLIVLMFELLDENVPAVTA